MDTLALIDWSCTCLAQISMVQRVIELLKFDCILRIEYTLGGNMGLQERQLEPRRENTCLITYANSRDAAQTIHVCKQSTQRLSYSMLEYYDCQGCYMLGLMHLKGYIN